MPLKIFSHPSTGSIRSAPDGSLFELTDASGPLLLHDEVAQEVNRIAGTQIEFYPQHVEETDMEDVHTEPLVRSFPDRYQLKAYVEWADSTPEVREEGFRSSFASRAWISRKDIEEAHAPPPSEGDVIRFWRGPFFDDWSVDSDKLIKNPGYFFNVTDVDDDGHLFDGPAFVGFWCVLQRNTTFTPERRMRDK